MLERWKNLAECLEARQIFAAVGDHVAAQDEVADGGRLRRGEKRGQLLQLRRADVLPLQVEESRVTERVLLFKKSCYRLNVPNVRPMLL